MDGTTITGHDAVKAYFEKERQMLDEHGSSITFEVFRVNLEAKTLRELQGEMLTTIRVDGTFVSGTDTVEAVKKKVRPLLAEASQSEQAGARAGLNIGDADRITLFFSGRPMQDKKLFYADHFMMLPVWVQIVLHSCELAAVKELTDKLRHASRE
ncbi:hypothetical protein [Polyangium sp. 6x1]|uniref:hypothetical protein n=1 Tax=Polyangium sp. 6x1 TaxID=3042689 RepID=UPI0024829AAD|nr:hypothetical protein [Polyangium sp. 6x1]MDI1451790.1 hypothetical protein [Polyangium sp. 6x1]